MPILEEVGRAITCVSSNDEGFRTRPRRSIEDIQKILEVRAGGRVSHHDAVVVCAGAGTAGLARSAGLQLPIANVLAESLARVGRLELAGSALHFPAATSAVSSYPRTWPARPPCWPPA